jgi:hypothetical protein
MDKLAKYRNDMVIVVIKYVLEITHENCCKFSLFLQKL